MPNQNNFTSLPSSVALGLILTFSIPPIVAGKDGAVATVDPIATDAAIKALESGGNAFDASVAAGLTLGVVNGYNSGIGGGCFVVARLPNGKVITVNGREKAPQGAHLDMYLRNGKPDTRMSQTGALAIAVPGALMAYSELCHAHGKIPFKKHLENAAKIASDGFKIPASYANRIHANAKKIKAFKTTAELFLDKNGEPKREGTTLKQGDLADTYRQIAEHGTDWFYKGPFAKKTEQWMKNNGGIMSAADFRKYHTTQPRPVRTTYRGYTVFGMPPPSSGGIHVAQMLNILEQFDMKNIKTDSPDFYHLITESMKLAFADRAHWLGDSDFTRVPAGLTHKEYAKSLAKKINMTKPTKVKKYGTPPRATEDFFNKHTTHFSCADSEGNWVAITATINTSFGSKVVIPGTGVIMNNEMDDFAIAPGVPNAFGLVGAEANAVAPEKRPLSSMSPTIVLKGNNPILATGAAGGPTIISQTLLTLIHTLDHNRSLQDALAQPRFHHQWKPDSIRIERKAGQEILDSLKERGHQLQVYESMGATQAVGQLNQKFEAAHDPRVDGKSVILPLNR